MARKRQKRLVLIGIHRKGEKGFKKIEKADPTEKIPITDLTNHYYDTTNNSKDACSGMHWTSE